ncbi:hypothetical protein GH714_011747 [Hevea brasiliensis]|uniref:Reverse transcriptase zinc-binding domain-containing protein n=1 Tax=Hevea brasiliensis TaxID=3981 RepID=A0A6A6MM17_HEVBR|nr:hypothetical protein GH714_011747 [Hevea brasiliensis]
MDELASLAKEGWRLLMFPNALFARIYQARYIPHSDFFSASLGSNPSYTWQIILEARLLLSIGDGSTTLIWNTPWLPYQYDPFVHSPNNSGMDDALVHDLMLLHTRAWNTELIPPEVKHFIWRSLASILPVMSKLVRKRVDVSNLCPVCGQVDDTIDHILLSCDQSSLVWVAAGFGTWGFPISSACWVELLFNSHSADSISQAFMLLEHLEKP